MRINLRFLFPVVLILVSILYLKINKAPTMTDNITYFTSRQNSHKIDRHELILLTDSYADLQKYMLEELEPKQGFDIVIWKKFLDRSYDLSKEINELSAYEYLEVERIFLNKYHKLLEKIGETGQYAIQLSKVNPEFLEIYKKINENLAYKAGGD